MNEWPEPKTYNLWISQVTSSKFDMTEISHLMAPQVMAGRENSWNAQVTSSKFDMTEISHLKAP